MPLSRAFANHGAGEKLRSITEGDHEDADDVLTILRSRRNHSEKRGNKSSSTSLSTASLKWESIGSSEVEEEESRRSSNSSKQPPNVSHTKKDHRNNVTLCTNLPDYTELANSIKQIAEAQQRQERGAKTTEDILQSIKLDVRQLQAYFTNTERHSEDATKSLDHIVKNVDAMSHSLTAMGQTLKSQIGNKRTASAEQRSTLQEERETLLKEKELLDAKKERMARERMQLERSEALFEQRKIAAAEDMEKATTTMPSIRKAEARLADEMRRLTQLRDFVVRKDNEAREKLTRVESLSFRIEGREASLAQDFENAERHQREVSEERLRLARERVSLLKERAKDKENRWLQNVRNQVS